VLYATWMDGAIYSQTLESTDPSLIVRRRSNGEARALGLEAEIDARVRDWLAGWVSFTAGQSEFTGGQLEGNRLPQVPVTQAAAGARVMRGRWLASIEARYWGRQFDDDRNTFELGDGFAANALASIRIAHAHIFTAIENIFDAEIDAGRTPLRTLAQPRTWTVGVRVATK
jgi:outer membrane receptor protein involved in Fe transport